MTPDTDSGADSGSQRQSRQIAKRVLAAELNDATYTFQDGKGDRAPLKVVFPTGASANRVLVSGTLLETEDVSNAGDEEYWRGRVNGPTGNYSVYAGSTANEGMQALKSLETPTYVAVIGKPRVYETDDGDRYVKIRPESINVIDEETRNLFLRETINATLDRFDAFDSGGANVKRATEQYSGDIEQYRDMVRDAINTWQAGESEAAQPAAADD